MGKKTRTVRKQETIRAVPKNIVNQMNRIISTVGQKPTLFMKKDIFDHIVSLNKKVEVTNDGN